MRRGGEDRFPRARRLRKGYKRKQVDTFLERVELAVQGAQPSITAADVRRAGFDMVRRGYDIAAVDQALDEMEEQLIVVNALASRRGRVDPQAEASFLRQELDAPYMRRFPRAGLLRRGYNIDDVDDFIDKVCATLDGSAGEAAISLAEVRRIAFRPRRGGYAEDGVDETLDRVIELMLLLKTGPVSPPPH
jgi:DivIVA domain-containing protein